MKRGLTLVLGGTGKTGRRVAERLETLGMPVRIGSRSANPSFDWEDKNTWAGALKDVESVYVSYYPDLAVPGAPDAIKAFSDLAVQMGVKRLVLLSGRGEEAAQSCETIIQESGAEWVLLRAGWFAQNFSEAFMRDLVMSGTVAFPIGNVKEPFIDVDDIADVAVAALTEDKHVGQLYEITGSRLLTFAEAIREISDASGREISYVQITPDQFTEGLAEQGVPGDYICLLNYLFTEVLDGRNAYVTDGVQRALGRAPRDFKEFATDAANDGAWGLEELEISVA